MLRGAAAHRLAALHPEVGPWTYAALWFGRIAVPVPESPLDRELDEICDQKLAPLLLAYVADAGVALSVSQERRLRQAAFAWTLLSRQVQAHGARAVAKLAEAKLPAAVSKGPGVATHYPAPTLRLFSDIDLIMTPRDFAAATRLLEADGWTEDLKNLQPWTAFRRFCREGLNLTHRNGGRIDLHHRLPPWLWSQSIDPAELIARSAVVAGCGFSAPVLSDVDNLLVTALHVVSDRNSPGQNLVVWRDVAELARVVDPVEAAAAARAAKLSGWLRAILTALPTDVQPQEIIRALPATPIPHQVRLSLVLGRRAQQVGVIATQALRLPMANAGLFLAGMAVPSHAFLDSRYPGARHPYLRWWKSKDRAPAQQEA